METADFLPRFAHKKPRAAPGVQGRYSNVAFILAGLAIERVTGQAYRSYVTSEIFGRAAMTGAGLFDRRDAEPDVAEGWDPNPDGGWEANIFSYPPIGSPDGGAQVTTAHLMRFLDAVRGGELLPPHLTELFVTPECPEWVAYSQALLPSREDPRHTASECASSARLHILCGGRGRRHRLVHMPSRSKKSSSASVADGPITSA